MQMDRLMGKSADLETEPLLPLDLQVLVKAPTLIGWILELQLGHKIHGYPPCTQETGKSQPIQPPALFTLILYCYSRGIFVSGEIEGRLECDPAMKYICAGSRPGESLIRRFRRDHKELIITCLAGVLRRAYEEKLRDHSCLLPPWFTAGSAADNSRHARFDASFTQEARSRYLRALQLDCLALDV